MRSLRWKIVALFFASIALAAASSTVLVYFAAFLFMLDVLPRPVEQILRNLYFSIGVIPAAAIVGLLLFILYVVLLSYRSIRYLTEIQGAVRKLAEGDLTVTVPVRTKDEMGQLADHINRMARQWQASMEQERAAVRSNQELITNVSHDLRTPLTSIMGYMQYMHEERYRDEVELRHYIDIAFRKAQRLNRLVNDLFEYVRMTYGTMKLDREPIDLMELLRQLAAENRLALSESGMKLDIRGPDHPVILSADGDKLMRVFENLLTNAMKYGKDGRKVDVDVQPSDGMVTVRVINYGEPIPAADLPHLFERFYRVEKSRSDEKGGTGLGLAIGRSIVELHGGTITASSDRSGTCFTVALPLARQTE
jgi:Signal transduction histidine kinase